MTLSAIRSSARPAERNVPLVLARDLYHLLSSFSLLLRTVELRLSGQPREKKWSTDDIPRAIHAGPRNCCVSTLDLVGSLGKGDRGRINSSMGELLDSRSLQTSCIGES